MDEEPRPGGDNTRIFDRVANTMYRDPNDFWNERVGAATGESAAEFVGREATAQYQPGVQRVMEGAAEEGIPSADIYYSPLQKWASEQMPDRMGSADFEATLLKGSQERSTTRTSRCSSTNADRKYVCKRTSSTGRQPDEPVQPRGGRARLQRTGGGRLILHDGQV